MSNTPLTITTATEAGQVAAAINNLQVIITDLQAAIASGASLYQMSCSLQGVGSPLSANALLSSADTAAIFEAILTVAQSNLTALNAQLAAF